MLNKVISCFAGLGCGELALKRCGIEVKNMYVYETDKYAEAVNRYHNPKSCFLGDIKNWEEHRLIGSDGCVDLIMGGSPCQDLSIAGKRAGLAGARSSLFYDFAAMVNFYKPRYFFLENVASMSKVDRDDVTEIMGVEPVLIDSGCVSPQSRKRLYWTNIPFSQPKKNSLVIKDILEEESEETKKYYTNKTYSSTIPKNKQHSINKPLLVGCLNNRLNQIYRVYSIHHKSISLDTRADTLNILLDNGVVRRITITEKERLFRLPDNWTIRGQFKTADGYFDDWISYTQRNKMIGNGWVVSVIEQFFRNIEC